MYKMLLYSFSFVKLWFARVEEISTDIPWRNYMSNQILPEIVDQLKWYSLYSFML